MKLTREHFDNMELFDPIPEGMTQDEFRTQAKAFIAEGWEGKEYREDEPVPQHKRQRERLAAMRRNHKHKYRCDIAFRLQEYADAGVLTRELSKKVRSEKHRRKLLRIRARYSKYLVPGYQMDELFSAMLEAPDKETRARLDEQAEDGIWDPDNEHFFLPKVVAPRTRKKYSKK